MNRPPPAAPPSLVVKEVSLVRSAAERITARRRTVTIRDTSDGCLAAGHANIRLGGRRAAGRARERASERVGDDATSRNRYLRTAPGGRAGKSGENAFPQIIPAAPPPRRPPSRPFPSTRFSEPEPASVAFGILAIPYQAISAGKGDGGGTGEAGTSGGRLSLRRTPTTHSDSHSVASPLSLLPAYPPAVPPSVPPSVVGISVSPSSHRNETEWNGGGTGSGGNRSYRPAGRRDTNAGERK